MEELQSRTVPLREIRNVPEIINASVDFFRLYRRSLGQLILTRALPFIVFGQVLSIFLNLEDRIGVFSYSRDYGALFSRVFVVLICQGLGYCVLVALVFAALRLAEQYTPDEF